jgi:hypothetical protein
VTRSVRSSSSKSARWWRGRSRDGGRSSPPCAAWLGHVCGGSGSRRHRFWGAAGEPIWPTGVQGSMTHCPGYAAAAVGLRSSISAIGIDAEPDAPFADKVLTLVATPAERHRLAGVPVSPGGPS